MSPRELIAKLYAQAEDKRDKQSSKAPVRRTNSGSSITYYALESEDLMQPPSYRMRAGNSF